MVIGCNLKFVSKSDSLFTFLDGDSLSISLSSYNSTNIAFLRLLKVQENADFIISTTDIPSEVGFVIVQVHTWIFNQSVAYDASQFSAGLKGSISGSNVGLFYPTDSESTVMTTVRNTNSFEVLALAAVVAYTKNGKSLSNNFATQTER